MLKGINHITIAVSELEKALQFYVDRLGCKLRARWHSGAYLSLGGFWLCLSKGAVVPSNDYSHIAFDIEASDFDQFGAASGKQVSGNGNATRAKDRLSICLIPTATSSRSMRAV